MVYVPLRPDHPAAKPTRFFGFAEGSDATTAEVLPFRASFFSLLLAKMDCLVSACTHAIGC